MPTGYTSFIESGECKSPKDFVHLCLRAFGICIDMRDESLSLDFEPKLEFDTTYHENSIKKAKENIEKLRATNLDEYKKQLTDNIRIDISNYKKYFNEYIEKVKVYTNYLNSINNWSCSEEFKNIKKFAIEQIENTLEEHTSSAKWYDDKIDELEKLLDNGISDEYAIEDFKNSISHCEWDISYHQGEIDSLKKKNSENRDFYKRFKEEIEKI